MESLKILGLLLRKNWLVRKRHWIISLFGEILLPAALILCIRLFFGFGVFDSQNEGSSNYYYEMQPSKQLYQLVNQSSVLYAPRNEFIDELMLMTKDCLGVGDNIRGFQTENDLVAFKFQSLQPDAVVFFDKSNNCSTKHFHYTILSNYPPGLYNTLLIDGAASYYKYFDPSAQLQICLDTSFIKLKNNNSSRNIPEIFVQRVPDPNNNPKLMVVESLTHAHDIFFIIIFLIPLFIQMSMVTNEKFQGTNILMSMNGISNTLNFFSWIISGLLPWSTLCAISTLIMYIRENSGSYHFNGDPTVTVLFVSLIVHVLHIVAFGLHISAYCSKPILVTLSLAVVNLAGIILHNWVFSDNYDDLILCMGVIFPNISFYQTLQIIRNYEEKGIFFQWAKLLENSHSSIDFLNVGLMLISSIIGIMFHFLLAVYIHAIKPGKYGIGKHPLFIFQCRNWRKKCVVPLMNTTVDNEYFEAISTEFYTVGIRIRNLIKTYDIGLFDKKKVEALRGISVDFYRGQITSLLGNNGAGKSTLMLLLTGMINPTDGMISIDSKNLEHNASEILNDVGLCAQDDIYFPSLTVTEHLEFFAQLRRANKCRSGIKEKTIALLNKLKLFNVKDALPDVLSEDQKRRLCLGIAFAGDPSIVILDEPTTRLDHENKRVIWDFLLEIKGDKTILMSTHDMEEADILGDRIAIIHEGCLISYGTSLFLKKMIAGQNNVDVTLSIANWSHSESIRTILHREAVIISEKDRQIIVSVPITSSLSRALDNLEMKKKDLGVSNYKLSVVSLKQVFLKVTREIYEPVNPTEIMNVRKGKLKGSALFNQSVRALLKKKATYVWKESWTLILQILTILISFVFIFVVMTTFASEVNVVSQTLIKLDMYKNPYALYSSSNTTVSEQYRDICWMQGGKSIKITDKSIDNELMLRAKQNYFEYNRNLVAAAEFNETTNGTVAIIFYSTTISYSLPISINLVTNTILKKLLGDTEYSIKYTRGVLSEPLGNDNSSEKMGLCLAVAFVILLGFITAMFVVHPARELQTGFKQLQKISGVSSFTYWTTMFLFDLMQYTFLISLIVTGLVCMGYSTKPQIYTATDIAALLLILMLYGINALLLAYVLSLTKLTTNTVVKLLTSIPIGTGLVGIAMLTSTSSFILVLTIWVYELILVYNGTYIILYVIQCFISILLPSTNLFLVILEFFKYNFLIIQCWNFKPESLRYLRSCYNLIQENEKYRLPWLANNQDRMIYFCLSSIIYITIITVIEGQYIQKIMSKYKKQNFTASTSDDEPLQREKLMIFQNVQALNERTLVNDSNEKVFLAYQLRKYYGKVKAVKDISFSVSHRECFGLFGTNKAGKSVTFKMITGGEIPDHGTMFMDGKHFQNDDKAFLSQIGYCPQQETILEHLNVYDHLRLFARLRGIPEKQIENEVQAWINRLNLKACASMPSSTYSGGNKQRLNIAIASIGYPNMLLLDEPTMGLDPGARHSFWEMIKSCQTAGQLFTLASHSMDECEAICNRMAIMVEGKLTCIGSPEELKQRFGAGYDVQIRFDPRTMRTQLDEIKNSMRLLLPSTLSNEYTGSLMYYISSPGTTWSRLYGVMNKLKSKYTCIDDYIVIVRLST